MTTMMTIALNFLLYYRRESS